MGVYDIPAELEYIFKVTGRQKLLYIGHSMGKYIMRHLRIQKLIRTSYMDESDNGPNSHRLLAFVSLFMAGTTMFWVAMETHPELNERIELMVLLNYS
jgi:triacylglycerol esterase/lipase EstA (alpha/beta hydrolase family)